MFLRLLRCFPLPLIGLKSLEVPPPAHIAARTLLLPVPG